MSEMKNKEVDDALHMLLYCSLKDHEYTTQKEQFDIIHDYIKELENKVEVQTICGYSIEEAIQILSAVTMSKIDVEWPPGGKEITIRKVDAEALEDYR